ncbi:MAG: glutathione S-transferase N-terminal domain-containing protein [Chlamydiia bacterium]|nr:glutathione S-transferase N-terminal domain-containing protein [Chlamydiia bacterium]
MSPKLYQYAVCPFCSKVDAILAYKGVPYDAVEVHPLNKKEIAFSKEYRKVPIYIDSRGNQVNDSTPIMRHIDREYPEKPVFESSPVAQAEEQKWVDWGSEVLVRALPPLIYNSIPNSLRAFSYITKLGKFSFVQRHFVKYSGAFAMYMVAKKSAKKQNIQDPVAHFKKALLTWSEALGSRKFLGGEKPNGADLANFGILRSIATLPAFRYVEETPRVHDWYKRIEGLLCLS